MADDRVGLEPAPDDKNLVVWLKEKLDRNEKEFNKIIEDFHEVINYGIEKGEPYEFGYARLLNFCATLNQKQIVELLAYSIWYIRELDS